MVWPVNSGHDIETCRQWEEVGLVRVILGDQPQGVQVHVYDKQSFRSVRDGVEKGHTGQRNRGEAEACADGGQEPALA